MRKRFMKFLVIVIFLQQCDFAVYGMLRPNAPQDVEKNTYEESEEVTPVPPYFEEAGVKSSSSHLKYLGCYDTWKSKFATYATNNYYEDLTLAQCEQSCINNAGHSDIEIFVTRGIFCGCTKWHMDDLVKLDDESCHIKCATTEGQEERSCGGNHANSLYCDPIESDNCRNYEIESHSESESESLESDESMEIQGLDFALSCFNCTNHLSCYTSSFDAKLAYIPENTPSVCVKFCAKSLEHYSQKTGQMETREATKYANVGWNSRGGFHVATCGCFDEFPQYEILSDEYCNTPCPANSEEMCGGNAPFIFTMYDTKWDQGTGSETISTTEVITSATQESSTSTIEFSSESSSPSTIDTTVAITSTVSTTDFATSTTEFPSSSTIGSTPETTTEWASPEVTTTTPKVPEDKTPTAGPCFPKCDAIDRHGIHWTECPGKVANGSCPRETPGFATWKCSPSGSFIGSPDYSQCSTQWIKNIGDQIGEVVIPEEASAIFESIGFGMKENQEELGNYFGHEINEIMGLVSKVFEKLTPNTDVVPFENLTDAAVAINENLLVNSHPWVELSIPNRSFVGTKLLQTIESSAYNLTSKATAVVLDKYRKFYETESPGLLKISAGGQSKSLTGNESLIFPFDGETGDGSFIRLPDGWANHVPVALRSPGAELNFIGMSISAKIIRGILPEASVASELNDSLTLKRMNGKLMSFSLAMKPNQNENMINFPGNGVKIRFRHDREVSMSKIKDLKRRRHEGEIRRPVLGSTFCVFWDTNKLEWSSKGCKLVKSERMATLCECSHLTSFAVLMDMHNYVGKDLGLEILTLIICPISIVCLLASIIIFTMVRSTHGVRTTITKNLCMSLLVGNTLVLLIVDRHYLNMSEGVCAGSAILVHYVFLTAFMWTAVQGYHLYKQMVHVFESGTSHMTIYRVIAFGVPLLIVGITAVVAFMKDDHAYGGEMFCWLQEEYIWSFMAPVAVICLANVVVLVITLRAAYHVQSPTNKIQLRVQSSRTWIKGCLSISVLLGLTWLSGYFMLIDTIGSTIAAYVFTILNASQGIFLFLFHCVLNEKVRSAAARKNIVLPSWFTSTGASRPTSSSQSKSKENIPAESADRAMQRNRGGQRIKRRSGSGKLQVHKPVAIVSSISSENTSNWSMKSASGNESTGSQINLLYAERKAPWRLNHN